VVPVDPMGYAMGTNAQSAVFTPYAMDRLGSNRGVGKYYPYGQDEGTPAPNDEVKFATYTRDSATGLDYAMNRYYSNSLGRFMTPDPTRRVVDRAIPRAGTVMHIRPAIQLIGSILVG